jgi:hypothetical protein
MWLITSLFIVSCIATFILRYFGIELKDIVRDLLLPLESIIVISYTLKSGAENVVKIKSTQNGVQLDSGNISIETGSETSSPIISQPIISEIIQPINEEGR